jgi:hypothetical protein
MTSGTQPFINLRWDALPVEHKLYNAPISLRIYLGLEDGRFKFEDRMNIGIKLGNYSLGPLDYGLSTAN